MIEAKKNNTFEEIDEVKHVEVFESDNQAIFKSDGENLKNYRIYGQTIDGASVGDRTGNLFDKNDPSMIYPNTNISTQYDWIKYTGNARVFRIPCKSNQTYTLSISSATSIFRISTTSTEDIPEIDASVPITRIINTANVKEYTFTTPNEAKYILFQPSLTDIEMVMGTMIVNEGSTALPYEPYGYKVPVTVEGKNLFNMKKFAELCYPNSASVIFADNTLSFTSTGTDAYVNMVFGEGDTVSNRYRPSCIDVLPSTTYTISMSSAPKCFISWIDSSYIAVSAYTRIPVDQSSYTFTTPSNCTKLLIRLGKTVSNIGDEFIISDIMLNEGSTALPYEPYHAPVTTPIYLPEQIKKVGGEAEYIDYGEQKQHRVRKNLLPNTATSQTINGVTFTVNDDGSVTCNGTATDTAALRIAVKPITLNGNYTLTGCPAGGNKTSNYKLDVPWRRDTGSDDHWNFVDIGSGVTLSFLNAITVYFRIIIYAGYTCNNLTFYPMIRKADIEDDTYEPYIENTEVDVTLSALPTVIGTNLLNVNTNIKPSKVWGRLSDPIDIEYVKDNLGNVLFSKYNEIENGPSLNYIGKKEGDFKNYKIYGNTSKNILPLSKTPKTETIGDILCEYDGKGTFTFISNVDNPSYPSYFSVDLLENFVPPIAIGRTGGTGCVQLNNTGHGDSEHPRMNFALCNLDEMDVLIDIDITSDYIISTDYEIQPDSPETATSVAFLNMDKMGRGSITFKVAMYENISTQQPFEPYGESVGDRTGNLFDRELVNNVHLDVTTGLPIATIGRVAITTPISINTDTYCLSFASGSSITINNMRFMYSVFNDSNLIRRVVGARTGDTIDASNGNLLYVAFYGINQQAISSTDISNIMLNEGSTALPYEPYGYKVPVTVSNGTDTLTTLIYLPEPIKMVGGEAEYIDYGTQKQHRVRKNLLQNIATSQTINGVTFTVNSDGSVTCNGECVNRLANFYIKTPLKFDDETIQYTLTGCPKGGVRNSTYILEYSNAVSAARTDSGDGVSFTPYSAADYPNAWVRIMIFVGYTCDNLTFYPMIRKADIEDDTYEPYITNTELYVTLPALPTIAGANTLSVGTEVQPSEVYIKGKIKKIN